MDSALLKHSAAGRLIDESFRVVYTASVALIIGLAPT
jgi:hypothetical protein